MLQISAFQIILPCQLSRLSHWTYLHPRLCTRSIFFFSDLICFALICRNPKIKTNFYFYRKALFKKKECYLSWAPPLSHRRKAVPPLILKRQEVVPPLYVCLEKVVNCTFLGWFLEPRQSITCCHCTRSDARFY